MSVALVTIGAACSSSTAAGPARTTTTTVAAGPSAGGARPRGPRDTATRPPTPAEAAMIAARPYALELPPRPKDPAPLVVLLHGYGADGALQAKYLKLQSATDARGMLLAVPDGTLNLAGRRFWNATDACCQGPRADVDDRAYVRAIIADVAAKHPVDPRRVYLVGHSNGGFMSYRMACDHAEVIAAIVSLEAATWNDPGRCRPSESVAVLEIHGTGDRTVAYDGGTIRGARYPGARRTARLWARYDGCAARPEDPPPTPRELELGRPPATVTAYATGCRGNGHVELWTVPGGVHIPPLVPSFADQIVEYLLAHPKR